MNPFALALALLDDVEMAGGRLSLLAEGVSLDGDVPEELADRLAALCGSGQARQALLTNRALRAVLAAPTRAARELLGVPVVLCNGLPVALTLRFQRYAASGPVLCLCSTNEATFVAATRAGTVTFLLRELDVAALAAEQGRATPAEFDRWMRAKHARPDWRVTPETLGVLEHLVEPGERAPLCFGELLDTLGCALVDVELHAKEAA